MKLINPKQLLKEIEFDKYGNIQTTINGLRIAMGRSEVEAEPVVRCKDCRWGREACGNIECFVDINIPPEYHGYDWFCPNGERRED